jgi:endonuclease YncB( thermonuclease family)
VPVSRRFVRTMVVAWLVLAASGAAAIAAELNGRIVGVGDGDTVDLLTADGVRVRVRLAGIDAPEMGQAFGKAAKQALAKLAYNREARVLWSKKDSYGRVVGKLFVQGADVNLQMIERGLAWHYRAYAAEQSAADRDRYAAAEAAARARRLGLWRDGTAIPPWVFRHPDRVPAASRTTMLDVDTVGVRPVNPGYASLEILPHVKFGEASGG